jgi:hypothetical protein
MAHPVVLFKKLSSDKVVPIKKTTSDTVSKEIATICNGNSDSKNYLDYVMYNPQTNTVLIGVEQTMKDFLKTLL